MASVVNTNVMSLNAQRQLGKSQSTQNEAMERLSSGLRINSAKDDAAGLAISTGMQSQITGINQAVRNAYDGVSMAQTAEGSMDEMTNILQRMRELSVQSANDTNSADNRLSIQKEVDQLSSELDRIAETTEFNGKKLLDGSAGTTTLQIGANAGQTLSFSIDGVTTADLGLNGGKNKGDLNGGRVSVIAAADVLINSVDIGAVIGTTSGNQANDTAIAINAKTAETGVTANAYNVVQGDSDSAATGITDGTMTIKNGAAGAVTIKATSSMDNLVDTINRDVSGVTAGIGEDGELLLTNDTGENITTTNGTGSGIAAGAYLGYVSLTSADDEPIAIAGANPTAGFLASNGAGSITSGTPAYDATNGITEADAIQINGVDFVDSGATDIAGTVAAINKLTDETGVTATVSGTSIQFSAVDGAKVEITSGASTQALRDTALDKLGMGSEMGGKKVDSLGVDVSTVNGATNTISAIDSALEKISESRAGLGAVQNRLDSTISNLENVSQNLSASNSRIQDADFASETSKMSKAQILQQAGTSMLSQANASAQSVLSLLG
jgi:flagellin